MTGALRAGLLCCLLAVVCARDLRLQKAIRALEELIEEENHGSGDTIRSTGDSNELGETALVRGGYQNGPLRVGAFNVQVFGVTKYSKEDVVQSLLLTMARYDILLFQEIRDSGGESFVSLMEDLNDENDNAFGYKISERLGRTSSKEQYAYIYRKSVVSVEDDYQYPDDNDVFEREPFGIVVTSSHAALSRFGFLGIHTKPDEAEKEVDAMVDVYNAFRSEYDLDDVVMMGDFNADCSYVTGAEWPGIRLFTDTSYEWLIGNEADTTVSSTDCAYDRAVVAGTKMKEIIVPGSATVYRFDTAQGLTGDQTDDVSDHYPIEFLIYGLVDPAVDDMITVSSTVTVGGANDFTSQAEILDALAVLDAQSSFPFFIEEISDDLVSMTAYGVIDVMETLGQLSENDPNVLSEVLLYVVQTYLEDAHALQDSPTFPGVIVENPHLFTIKIYLEPQDTVIYISKQAA